MNKRRFTDNRASKDIFNKYVLLIFKRLWESEAKKNGRNSKGLSNLILSQKILIKLNNQKPKLELSFKCYRS